MIDLHINPKWESYELQELVTICRGAEDKPASFGKYSGKYRLYTASSLKTLWCDEPKYTEPHVLLNSGGSEILVSLDDKFDSSTNLLLLRIINEQLIIYEYLYYYLLSITPQLTAMMRGSTNLKHLNIQTIKPLKVFIPPYNTQQYIVEEHKTQQNIKTITLQGWE